MNDFLRNLRKKASDYKRNNQYEINKAKRMSFSFYEEVVKKGESINQKIRMEKIYMESKYGDQIKNQNLNSIHSKWLSFRDKYLSTHATQALHKLKGLGESTSKVIEDAKIPSKLYSLQQKLQEKGYDTTKLNQISKKGYSIFQTQFQKASKAFNDRNFSKYFYSPLNYCTQFVLKNKSRAFKGVLLLAFFYGLGAYIPVAIKDYYLQKQMLMQHTALQQQQLELQLEQQRLLALQNKQSINKQ